MDNLLFDWLWKWVTIITVNRRKAVRESGEGIGEGIGGGNGGGDNDGGGNGGAAQGLNNTQNCSWKDDLGLS